MQLELVWSKGPLCVVYIFYDFTGGHMGKPPGSGRR